MEGGAAATRKGRVMVVTRMTCLRRDLSDMPEGRKLTSASNGRCDGSGDGRSSSARRLRIPLRRSLSMEKIVRAEEVIEVAFKVDETADGAPLLEHC